MAHVRVPGQRRCYFVVTEDGRPVRLQRKPYTECFYVMAMAEMHRATARKQYKVGQPREAPPPPLTTFSQMEAEEMFAAVKHWVRVDDSGLGAERLEGAPAYQELGRPMMLLNVLAEVCGGAGPGEEEEREKHRADIDWCVEAIQQHVSEHSPPTFVTRHSAYLTKQSHTNTHTHAHTHTHTHMRARAEYWWVGA